MGTRKIVIVGGVAGGATAATRLRRLDETAEILLFERGPSVSFANCGLPYHIGEVIPKRGDLLVQTAEGLARRFQLDVRVLSEVLSVDRDRQKISVKNLSSGNIYEEAYDILVLSPGAQPIVPPIPGLKEAKQVFSLRSLSDMDTIKRFIDLHHPAQALVIGGGFIGLEMAENLQLRGSQVTVVEMLDQVMAPLDYEMASLVHQHLHEKGIRLLLGDGVKAFEDQGRRVLLQSGKALTADMIILSIGVRPENTLAIQAGLEVGERGGILVDEHLRTGDEHIYALGDAIEVKDYLTHRPTQVPLAWPANRQGRLVADILGGKNVAYKGTLGTAIVKVFDLTVATTGLNEKSLRRLGWKYQAVHIHPSSHASYYPGSHRLSLKLLFQPETGAIYGAQGVGGEGVDKRIDVLATAIKGGLTVFDLPDLELAYAPPYSSAKDPINVLGYVASNIAAGDVKTVQFDQIDQLVAEGALLIDVRDPQEVAQGAIPGSINIPLDDLRQRLAELPTDAPIYVTCRVGQRGYLACRILEQHGREAINLDGGYLTYQSVKLPVEASNPQESKRLLNIS